MVEGHSPERAEMRGTQRATAGKGGAISGALKAGIQIARGL
jgi:hypothetical protein